MPVSLVSGLLFPHAQGTPVGIQQQEVVAQRSHTAFLWWQDTQTYTEMNLGDLAHLKSYLWLVALSLCWRSVFLGQVWFCMDPCSTPTASPAPDSQWMLIESMSRWTDNEMWKQPWLTTTLAKLVEKYLESHFNCYRSLHHPPIYHIVTIHSVTINELQCRETPSIISE